MRTIEETRAHIQALHDEIENGDVRARHNGPNCPGCLYSLLEFIDSEPPCRHPRAYFCFRTPTVYQPKGSAWYFANCGTTDDNMKISYCPDCGEELPPEGWAEGLA